MRNVNGPCRVLSRVPKGSLGRPECVACLPNTAVALQCASDSARSKHVEQYDRSVTDGHRAKCTGGLNDFLCIMRSFRKGMLEHLTIRLLVHCAHVFTAILPSARRRGCLSIPYTKVSRRASKLQDNRQIPYTKEQEFPAPRRQLLTYLTGEITWCCTHHKCGNYDLGRGKLGTSAYSPFLSSFLPFFLSFFLSSTNLFRKGSAASRISRTVSHYLTQTISLHTPTPFTHPPCPPRSSSSTPSSSSYPSPRRHAKS